LSAFGTRKTQCFGKQLVSRHDMSLTPKTTSYFTRPSKPAAIVATM
jgi:hypothetical protein